MIRRITINSITTDGSASVELSADMRKEKTEKWGPKGPACMQAIRTYLDTGILPNEAEFQSHIQDDASSIMYPRKGEIAGYFSWQSDRESQTHANGWRVRK